MNKLKTPQALVLICNKAELEPRIPNSWARSFYCIALRPGPVSCQLAVTHPFTSPSHLPTHPSVLHPFTAHTIAQLTPSHSRPSIHPPIHPSVDRHIIHPTTHPPNSHPDSEHLLCVRCHSKSWEHSIHTADLCPPQEPSSYGRN